MSNSIRHEFSQRSWITTTIGWLSLCIIASAWGYRLLPVEWRNLWGEVGVFGLAAALGLASVAATRRHEPTTTEQS